MIRVFGSGCPFSRLHVTVAPKQSIKLKEDWHICISYTAWSSYCGNSTIIELLYVDEDFVLSEGKQIITFLKMYTPSKARYVC